MRDTARKPADAFKPLRFLELAFRLFESRDRLSLARMAASPVKDAALADAQLLADVVAFKQRFYPRNWARYDLAVRGTLRLLPADGTLKALEDDYRAMAHMIFGARPDFADIAARLRALEAEINGSDS